MNKRGERVGSVGKLSFCILEGAVAGIFYKIPRSPMNVLVCMKSGHHLRECEHWSFL